MAADIIGIPKPISFVRNVFVIDSAGRWFDFFGRRVHRQKLKLY